MEIWFKPLAGGDWAMCALNRGRDAQKISFDWKQENVSDNLSKRDANFSATTYGLRDVWTKKEAGTTRRAARGENFRSRRANAQVNKISA